MKRIILAAVVSFGSLASGAPHTRVDLLAYLDHNVESTPIAELKTKIQKYVRLHHFGTWIDGDEPRDCQNARAEVLIRSADPRVPVTYTSEKNCSVSTGLWHDPYSATDFQDAIKDIQIDHVIPLHHAYLMGAHAWTFKKRCSYANYLGNDFHLLAVSGKENMLKLDRAPDQYMPPNKAFQCTYLHDWLRIKAIWELRATPSEISAIKNIIQSMGCTVAETTMTQAELYEQRSRASALLEACPDEPPPIPPATGSSSNLPARTSFGAPGF